MATSYPPSAYLDTSVLLTMAFEEPDAAAIAHRLASYPRWVSSNLLEAEVRSALAREGNEFDTDLLARVQWVTPTRSLGPEITAALRVGYLRGADLWHIASALYAAQAMPELAFITLDRRQQRVAAGLGFVT